MPNPKKPQYPFETRTAVTRVDRDFYHWITTQANGRGMTIAEYTAVLLLQLKPATVKRAKKTKAAR